MTDKKRGKPVTAAELISRLEQDPRWLAERHAKELRHAERVRTNKAAAAPIIKDLASAGFAVDSIADLFNKKLRYQKAIPLLLNWLPKVDNLAVKEDLVRALSVEWAKRIAAPVLIRELKRMEENHAGSDLQWVIASALAVVADDSVFEDIIGLIQEARYGKAREMIVLALGNMVQHKDAATTILIDLLGDETVVGFAAMALGKLKAEVAHLHLQPLLNHEKSWVRKEAKKALKNCQ